MLPRSLLPLAIVIATYAIAALLIPTFAPVAISDDWTYARSVEYLVRQGRYHIVPVAAATMVFQLFWGGSFSYIFGMSFGALRFSTVVITFLGGLAFYGTCREIGINRNRSALGTAVYLFNPVLFPITYTFMSDPQFLGLLAISSYFYVCGLRPGLAGERAALIGSVVAALACLQRPHGVLIPLGVLTYLSIANRFSWNRESLKTFFLVAFLPVATTIVFYVFVSHGIPSQQGYFLKEAKAAGFGQTWLLVRRLTFIEMMYTGLFVIPIVAAALPAIRTISKIKAGRPTLLFATWTSILLAGYIWFWNQRRRMPYIPHFFGRAGPGSADLRGARPPLAGPTAFDRLTVICAIAAGLFALCVAAGLSQKPRRGASGAGILTVLLAWQVVGVVTQSLLFRNWIISLDRYLLPLLPFILALLLWSLNNIKLSMPIGWTFAGLFAFYSIIGTRDVLVFQTDVWKLAGQLNAEGIPDTRLDAGYPWDAYHLWEFSEQYHIPRQTPDGSWWTDVYATATNSDYVISGAPLRGYDVIEVQPYSAWLQHDQVYLMVCRRQSLRPPK